MDRAIHDQSGKRLVCERLPDCLFRLIVLIAFYPARNDPAYAGCRK